MADQNGNGAGAPQAGPRFSVLAQYTKDFSFENPNAPRTLGPQQTAPNISIQINVNARQLAPSDYEVSLMLEGGAGRALIRCSSSNSTMPAFSGSRIFQPSKFSRWS